MLIKKYYVIVVCCVRWLRNKQINRLNKNKTKNKDRFNLLHAIIGTTDNN